MYPALKFQQVVDGQGEDQGPVFLLLDPLAWVPVPLTDEAGGRPVEADADRNFVVGPVDAEVAAGMLVKIKIRRNAEAFGQLPGPGYPGQAEGPDLVAQVAVSDYVPVAVKTDPMVRINPPDDRFLALPRLIHHLQAVQVAEAGKDRLPYLRVQPGR